MVLSSQEGDRGDRWGVRRVVRLSMPREADAPERFEVNAATCELDSTDGLWSMELVELAHYRGHRYSLAIMTAAEARDLARLLLDAADECPPDRESQARARVQLPPRS